MSHKQHFARRFRYRRALEANLAAGGFFNITLGVLLFLAPDSTLGVFHLPRPVPGFYLQLLALIEALLGCYYILAASDVRRYSGAIALAIVGRFIATLVLLLASAGEADLSRLRALAGVEALLGGAHAATWWSIRS